MKSWCKVPKKAISESGDVRATLRSTKHLDESTLIYGTSATDRQKKW